MLNPDDKLVRLPDDASPFIHTYLEKKENSKRKHFFLFRFARELLCSLGVFLVEHFRFQSEHVCITKNRQLHLRKDFEAIEMKTTIDKTQPRTYSG